MLYAPFRANRYDGCGEKRPLRRSLVTTKGARSTTTTTMRKRKVENWKPGDKVVTAKSGKSKRSNCLIWIQSKGSPVFIQIHTYIHTYIHLGCWLTHSTHGDPFTVTFAGKQQSGFISETRWLLSIFGLFGSGAASKGGGLRVLLICI